MIAKFLSSGYSYILFLWAIFLIMIGLFLYHYSYFLDLFSKINKKKRLLLFLILFSALIMRIVIIPQMHHVYYDEFNYIHIAQNMYYHNIFGYTLKGDRVHPEIASKGFYRPGGYPFLLYLTFKLFGDSEKVTFYLNCFLGSLSVLLVFFIGYLLFDSIYAGFWSAFVFNLLPSHLKYSGSSASDVSSLFFILLAALTTILYFKYKKTSILYLLSSVILFTSYIRPENAILFLFYIPLLFIEFRSRRLIKKELLNLLYFSIILLLPLFKQIPFMFQQEKISANGSFWSLRYFFINFIDNFKYIFHIKYNLFFASIFFLFGSITLFIKNRKLFYLLMGWFLIFFIYYTCFFMGNFLPNKTTDSDRHFFSSGLSFSILAGYGLYILVHYLHKKITVIITSILIFILLILNSFFVTKRLVNMTINRDVFREYRFIKKSINELPDNLYILDYQPSHIISVFNKKAISLDIFFENRDFPGELVLLKGFWWHTHMDESKKYESLLKDIYDFELLQEIEINPGLKYSFLKLTMKYK